MVLRKNTYPRTGKKSGVQKDGFAQQNFWKAPEEPEKPEDTGGTFIETCMVLACFNVPFLRLRKNYEVVRF